MNALAAFPHGSDAGLTGTSAAPGLLASLSSLALPLDPSEFALALSGVAQSKPGARIEFRFLFGEVAFRAHAEDRRRHVVLTLVGDLGFLPFTIENSRRRRRLRNALAAARRGSGLRWEITPGHEIRVTGDIELPSPLAPVSVITGAVTLLARGRPYLDLVVSVAGEE